MRVAALRGLLVAGTLVATGLAPARLEAGAWVLPKGEIWAKASLLRQTTDERYFLDGERIPYFFEGTNESTGLFFDLRYGLAERLEVGAQLPMYDLRFDDLADSRRSTGIGDLRLAARYAVLRGGSTVATVEGAVKVPTGEFVNDAEVVPVGQGQWDFDVVLSVGHSFWPRRAYVTGRVGYRFRTANDENGIHPGDELVWSAELGHRIVSRLGLKLAARGLHGGRSRSFGIEIPTLKREAVYLSPGLTWELGPARGVELSFPFTVTGRNWPAGLAVGIGFYSRF
jgi:hypothetical protein